MTRSTNVAQKVLIADNRINWKEGCSGNARDILKPMMQSNVVLYTQMPISLLSFRAGIVTCVESKTKRETMLKIVTSVLCFKWGRYILVGTRHMHS